MYDTSFSQVHKPRYISQCLGIALKIQFVDFYPGYVHPRINLGNGAKPGFVVVPEEMPEEKVPVFVILRTAQFKLTTLSAVYSGIDLNGLTFAALCRGYCCYVEPSKPKLGFDAEEVLGTGDQAVLQREAHIADLDFLNNIFFETGIFYFKVVFKVERVIVVEISRDGHFLANFTYYVHADLLVKHEAAVSLLAYGYLRVLYPLPFSPQVKRYEAVGLNIHVAPSEYSVENRADVNGRNQASAAHGALTV